MHRWFANPLALFALLGIVFWTAPTPHVLRAEPAAPIGATISVRDAFALAESGRIQLVDIRRPSEWRQTGIAANAATLTMHQPFPSFLAKVKALAAQNGMRQIAIICAAGVRTARMQKMLARHGVRVVNVHPGMTGTWLERGWIQNGFPTRRWPG